MISSIQLMELTKQKPWSQMIGKHRLRWFGHCKRLPDDSPAKRALEEFERQVTKPVGRPATTWMEVVKRQVNQKGLKYEEAVKLTQDRINWRRFVNQ
jgi:hypothetical protein